MMDITHTTHHVKVGHAAEDDKEVHQSQERHSDGDATAHCSKLLLLHGSAPVVDIGYSHIWHLVYFYEHMQLYLADPSIYSRGASVDFVRQLKEKNIDVRVMDLAGKKKRKIWHDDIII